MKTFTSLQTMGSKEHPPSQWTQLSKKDRICIISVLITTLLLIYKQWHSPSSLPIELIEGNNCTWHPLPLLGVCDVTKSTQESAMYDNAMDCENACCDSDSCISFQYRSKEGCMWGGDTRLGAEKDGVSAWCEPRAPAAWHGQWIKKDGILVDGTCDDGWNANELQGQCFGLGSKKATDSNTAQSCRDSCCAPSDCAIWQWRVDAGCFYGTNAHGCQEANALDLEAFIGKRKLVKQRSYTPFAYSHDFADMTK
eukprot:217782_1